MTGFFCPLRSALYSLSCQWPCSADQTFPAGGLPAGCGVSVAGAAGGSAGGVILIGEAVPEGAALCQWPCSSDHTLPAGAAPGGCLPGVLAGAADASIGSAGVSRFAVAAPMRPRATTRPIAPRRSISPFDCWRAPFPAQHALNFFPLLHGHGSFLPTLIDPPAEWTRTTVGIQSFRAFARSPLRDNVSPTSRRKGETLWISGM